MLTPNAEFPSRDLSKLPRRKRKREIYNTILPLNYISKEKGYLYFLGISSACMILKNQWSMYTYIYVHMYLYIYIYKIRMYFIHIHNSLFSLYYCYQKLSLSVYQWRIESPRQSFGWSRKEELYCFARQRGPQWASASKNCVPTWEDLRRGFITMIQRWKD